jgi:hypothetical protein
VYSMPFLSYSFRASLLEEIQYASNLSFLTRPNSMNNYGLQLREIGFGPWLDRLMEEAIKPISALLFPLWGGASLDSEHTFSIAYRFVSVLCVFIGCLYECINKLVSSCESSNLNLHYPTLLLLHMHIHIHTRPIGWARTQPWTATWTSRQSQ